MAARDVRIVEDDVALPAAPEHRAARADDLRAAAVDAQARLAAPGIRLAQRLRQALRGRIDHRVPLVALARGLVLARRRAYEPRLDPELAQPQGVVRAELDRGAGDERDPLAAG